MVLVPRVEKAARGKPVAGPVIEPLPLGTQLQRIGGSLTPQTLTAILSEADLGYMWRLVDLENEARQKDGHLQCILATRELAVSGLPWEVVAPDGGGARDKRAAAFCGEVFRAMDDLPTLFAHMQGAVYHAYAVAEGDWQRVDGDVIPVCYRMQPARRFAFEQTSQCLHWWDATGPVQIPGAQQSGGYPGIAMDSFPAGQFVIHQPRINGDVPCREGLGRVLMWLALMRNWAVRDWLALAELAWKPWRTGSYLKTADQKDIDNLVAILRQMSSSGVAVYPETTKLDIHWPDAKQGNGSNHGDLIAFLAAEMSKATLGQTLTTEQGKVGSQALGNVHNDVRKDIRESDARALAATIRRDILAPLIRYNFSAGTKVPLFRFLTEDAPDLKLLAEVCEKMAKLMPVPVSWAQDQMGIPEPIEDEPLLVGWTDPDEVDVDLEEDSAAPPADDDEEEPAEAA